MLSKLGAGSNMFSLINPRPGEQLPIDSMYVNPVPAQTSNNQKLYAEAEIDSMASSLGPVHGMRERSVSSPCELLCELLTEGTMEQQSSRTFHYTPPIDSRLWLSCSFGGP